MNRLIKIVPILAVIFFIVILWVGIKNKKADLSKAKPKSLSVKPEVKSPVLKGKTVKLSGDDLNKIDETLRKLEKMRETATAENLRNLDRLKQMLELTKEKGRLLSAQELQAFFPESAKQEDLPPILPEEALGPEESPELAPEEAPAELLLPEQIPPEELSEEYQR